MTPQDATAFGPPLIGQTEKALNAILTRELEGAGVSEPGWVLMKLTAAMGGGDGREALVGRAAAVSKLQPAVMESEIDALVESGFLATKEEGIVLTAKARDLQERVGARVGEITARLWGDLPSEDLATAGRVLGTVLDRANAELDYSI